MIALPGLAAGIVLGMGRLSIGLITSKLRRLGLTDTDVIAMVVCNIFVSLIQFPLMYIMSRKGPCLTELYQGMETVGNMIRVTDDNEKVVGNLNDKIQSNTKSIALGYFMFLLMCIFPGNFC